MTLNKFAAVVAVLASSFVLGAANARAAMLGAYDFENATGLASVDTDLNSTAGVIISGTGMNALANTSRGEQNVPAFVAGTNDQSLSFTLADAATGNAADARAADDLFTLTVSANPGYLLNLEDLTFRTAMGNIVLNRTWTLDYALNGGSFVNDFDTGNFTGPQTTTSNNPVWTPFTVNFSDMEFDGIESITLRFVQHGEFNSTHAGFIDKIVLNGLTELAPLPVPEPSSALMLALGLVISALRRKHR